MLKRSVLIVEDEADIREMVSYNLLQDGYRVDGVGSGEEALALVESRDFDVILLDLKMPIKDGHEALLQIKEEPDLRHIPVMAMTASKSEGDISRAYKVGINSYITKPTSFPEMVSLMETLGKYWLDTVELPVITPLDSET